MALTIQNNVRQWAEQWGLDPLLLQALVTAEGDIIRAVQCSVKTVQSEHEALMIACRSLTHRLWEYAKGPIPGDTAGKLGPLYNEDFVDYFCRRWAPVGAANDPTGLNRNLPKNLRALWLGPPPLTVKEA